MSAQAETYLTLEDYFQLEEQTSIKYEYYRGRVYAMTGASIQHNLIVSNVLAQLYAQLQTSSCRVFPSDLRVKVEQSGLYTYPDISVVCGSPELTTDRPDTITNPQVLCEVLSPSTEHYDRGGKFEHYRTITSLQEYLVVAQRRPHVELYVRQSEGRWLLLDFHGLDQSITLHSLECTLKLADIYAYCTFADQPPADLRP